MRCYQLHEQELLSWLKEQAALSYTWDEAAKFYRVTHQFPYAIPNTTSPAPECLTKIFAHATSYIQAKKHRNLMIHAWPTLSRKTQDRISDFIHDHGLYSYSFFDYGGRAVVLRATEASTHKTRIVRIEADHKCRTPRLTHPTVLQPYATNEGQCAEYDGIKLEILPEVMPLHNIPDRPINNSDISIIDAFDTTIVSLAQGTNLTYPEGIFDSDSEPQNVGLLPDGKIVSIDPQYSEPQEKRRKRFISQSPHLTKEQLEALYGLQSNDLFF